VGELNGCIIALDILPMAAVEGVQFIQGDFRENEVAALLEASLQGRQVDVVVSDMAPNLSGIDSTDAARVTHLIELAVEFVQNHLKPQGALVVKVFHGSGYSQIVKMFKETFQVVKAIKPKSSRDKSAETFLVGMGLKTSV
jgi:23S rRNA (uridine2552-2'-O)-methyltransferase